MITYETQLNNDLQWALREGSMHFEGDSAVHKTLRRIAQKLTELKVDYAIAGGMALFFHGYRRFTEQVDILVTSGGLRKIHENLDTIECVKVSSSSKNLRDTATGVKIAFQISGQYPAESELGSFTIPNPQDVSVELAGLPMISLGDLIKMKIQIGQAQRVGYDLSDVQSLIQARKLPRNFAENFEPNERDWYEALWIEAQQAIADEYEEFPAPHSPPPNPS